MGVVNLRFDDEEEEARGGPGKVEDKVSRVGEVGKGVKSTIATVPRGVPCLLKIGFSAFLLSGMVRASVGSSER